MTKHKENLVVAPLLRAGHYNLQTKWHCDECCSNNRKWLYPLAYNSYDGVVEAWGCFFCIKKLAREGHGYHS